MKRLFTIFCITIMCILTACTISPDMAEANQTPSNNNSEYNRLNPAPTGTAQTLTIDNYDYSYTVTIKVDEILAKEGMNQIIGSTVANDAVDKDCEFVAAKISLKLDDISDDEKSVYFDKFIFTAFTSNNESLDHKYVYLKDGNWFDSTLYAGGEMSGYIIMQRKIDDDGAKMAFGLN